MSYDFPVLTFASTPKPFLGHIGIIQRNAVGSWLQMHPRPHVILFGNEEGTAEVAKELGVEHVPDVERNAFGTPLLPPVFRQMQERAHDDLVCYSNCDIILFQDFLTAASLTRQVFPRFLLLAECRNLDVRSPIDFSRRDWEARLRGQMLAQGRRRVNASDFFAFTRGMFPAPPPFTLGRAYFDNWVIWETRRMGLPVVDATGAITAIHQNHHYVAVPGETTESHNGVEAQENLAILGGKPRVYWITDRTHRMTDGRIRRDLVSSLLLQRRWQGVVKKFKYIVVDALRAVGMHE